MQVSDTPQKSVKPTFWKADPPGILSMLVDWVVLSDGKALGHRGTSRSEAIVSGFSRPAF
jgi:hypothetical protein